MSNYSLKVMLELVAALMMVSIGAKAVGALQPPNPALRGFVEGCMDQPQPCWYGVVPGKTIPPDTLTHLGHYRVESPGSTGGPVIFGKSVTNCNVDITLKDNGEEVDFYFIEGNCNLRLGDLLPILGRPDFINQSDVLSSHPLMLLYRDGTRIWPDMCCRLSLYSRVKQLFLTSYDAITSPALEWQGFVPNWRYCRVDETCTP
jgi:hypothetical protein